MSNYVGMVTFLLLAALVAEPLELNAGLTTEVRAGQSPVLGNQDSRAFVATVATPGVEMTAKDGRLDLRVTYFPRLVWQSPNALDQTGRPLVLHQAALALLGRPTARVRLAARAFGAYGQPDYSALPQLIGAGAGMPPAGGVQAAVPEVQTILTLSAGLAVDGDVTRRWKLGFALDGTHFRPITEAALPDPTPGVASLPLLRRQTTITGAPSVVYRLTEHDDLALTVAVTDARSHGDVEIGRASATFSWRARRG